MLNSIHTEFGDDKGFIDSDLGEGILPKQREKQRKQLAFTFTAIAPLAALVAIIFLFVKLQEEFYTRYTPVGSDYIGGFVPTHVNARRRFIADGRTEYEISSNVFESTAVLNDTIMMWNRLAPGASFVRTESTRWRGNEVPLETHNHGSVFQIAGLHQMHCLTSIFRDYSLLLMGYSADELYDDMSIEAIRGHSTHCFNIIRSAIMCLADGTALGSGDDPYKVESAGKIHVCNDYDALLEWATDPIRKMPDNVRGVS